jgi:hypothetical protein
MRIENDQIMSADGKGNHSLLTNFQPCLSCLVLLTGSCSNLLPRCGSVLLALASSASGLFLSVSELAKVL